ncbi:ABC transporter substrate-binding protein [Paenilisteria rocourtiae]|uniref:Iron complex transport system substrate-binding protein n=1 Tax=Listeria rocourtiae TaxID=647910 RepID=A0A4R6ZQA8_9LIST|nr:ABC transporter substrate-binding protein [Listeria rocourtiae]EUJ48422.1 ABC transporter substrate-binding protein [Listeria rocourtiae FSL F6-920]MBC1605802.1 ABC transporter substrate-binding protein [Listeria rocourtiae]TDR54791.1 iron complex transport system substrate-binding protein [Listeria rocourtiae]
MNFKKIIIASSMAILLALAGCSAPTTSEKPTQSSEYIATDATGTKIELSAKPKKIVSLIPSNTEILYRLGLGENVIGVTSSDDYPAAVKQVPVVATTEINVEKIIGMKPDLVLGHASMMSYNKDAYNQITKANIPLFVVEDAQNFDAAYNTFIQIGDLTGTTKDAEKLVSSMQASGAVKERARKEKAKVWLEISPDLYTAGQETFINEMLTNIQATNIVSEKGYPQYSEEQVIQAAPDVIITIYPNAKQEIAKRSAWKNIPAVKNNRIYEIDPSIVSRPGPRLMEGQEALLQAIYP